MGTRGHGPATMSHRDWALSVAQYVIEGEIQPDTCATTVRAMNIEHHEHE